MQLLLDSFWRSAAYCLHPRVIALSFLPVLFMAAATFGLSYWFWDGAVAAVSAWLQGWDLVQAFMAWLDHVGADRLRAVVAPLIVLLLGTPLVVLTALLLVGLFMTPAIVDLVAQRRFAQLERRGAGGWWSSLAWALWSTVVALLCLVVTLPLWLVPPLVLILPPLIWGWLAYRVFAFDALSSHATRTEREALLRQYRTRLWAIGVACGFLGAAPSLLWASGAMFVAMAPLLVPLAVWVYALVFAFASLWFAHFLLAALDRLRRSPSAAAPANVPSTDDPVPAAKGPSDAT
jgi:Etoposide-induced protein 2.4 (EI24)